MFAQVKLSLFCGLIISATACHALNQNTVNGNSPPSPTPTTASEPSPVVSPPAADAVIPQGSAGATDERGSETCKLLTNAEFTSIIGSDLKTTTPSVTIKQGYRTAQCMYIPDDITRGLSMSVTRANPNDPQKYSVATLWKDTFMRRKKDKEEREEEEKAKSAGSSSTKLEDEEDEDEGKGPAPKKISGLGNGAYWVTSTTGSALCVLKGDMILRISLGGHDDIKTKLKNSMALARVALLKI